MHVLPGHLYTPHASKQLDDNFMKIMAMNFDTVMYEPYMNNEKMDPIFATKPVFVVQHSYIGMAPKLNEVYREWGGSIQYRIIGIAPTNEPGWGGTKVYLRKVKQPSRVANHDRKLALHQFVGFFELDEETRKPRVGEIWSNGRDMVRIISNRGGNIHYTWNINFMDKNPTGDYHTLTLGKFTNDYDLVNWYSENHNNPPSAHDDRRNLQMNPQTYNEFGEALMQNKYRTEAGGYKSIKKAKTKKLINLSTLIAKSPAMHQSSIWQYQQTLLDEELRVRTEKAKTYRRSLLVNNQRKEKQGDLK